MKSDFSVDFFSDSRYEELTAEISYKGQIVCQLNKDKGENAVEVEFFTDSRLLSESVEMKFLLDEFIAVLNEAKLDLIA
ncbi:hypothetical protein DL122_25935 [Salmonella enterica subsp. salamae]|uniref:Uncharacterized protein n=1 Tax=Salmonella enterica subsp. salamae TaxID=59202 RepID=A0A5Y3XG46_SALER|nr:hypothetical protein [Salmonella enterica]ECC9297463.1 hypothetical protein [Salmonella enterica subsp. salamae]EDV1139020.1 hypothetical protein [Salmonella enterica subsp. enterica]HCA3408314.1 hypothetical protein [Salmonella enterica subsp. salamae serovar 35:g,m,s,t:-]HCM1945929.1 hypothetical protein [Salmonella enterica subsp. salamae serovar 30:g,m,s:e,n,x]HCM1974568.1 hypothetical protein [Salmonella enterica subsp. salamae serovar 52:z:z39]HCM2005841.1 hypothetical protein [Salmo